MALTKQAEKSRLHFWMRLSGLTGFVVLIAGIAVLIVTAVGGSQAVAAGQPEQQAAGVAFGLLVGIGGIVLGGILLGVAIFVEVQAILAATLSQKGAVGGNVALQVILAAVLLAGVNLYA